MKILDRENTVTVEVDLNNYVSVMEAIGFIRKECRLPEPTGVVTTNKIKLIKLVRAYGREVASSATIIEDGTIEHKEGLKAAKLFVEKELRNREIQNM